MVIIDDVIEEGRRELIENGLNNGLLKLYLAGLRRFVKILTNQLTWYGVPYQFKRLPSTKCPICEHELRQLPGRVMVCDQCEFKANRDLVPIQWAIKIRC
ncbi:zinc ribbon domain-containing protein [Vulcanisaeta sp. JCM 14467]|uniref:zinc ribbon domain-containing protein n=1 Tax=Vulcanisaeta sp. JCM 14467 TaxID=1295370 RepID=UPI0006D037C0|nr:zinc ribbon domain-containing protein [Vulcanisaeta sp. JCM 14467]